MQYTNLYILELTCSPTKNEPVYNFGQSAHHTNFASTVKLNTTLHNERQHECKNKETNYCLCFLFNEKVTKVFCCLLLLTAIRLQEMSVYLICDSFIHVQIWIYINNTYQYSYYIFNNIILYCMLYILYEIILVVTLVLSLFLICI